VEGVREGGEGEIVVHVRAGEEIWAEWLRLCRLG